MNYFLETKVKSIQVDNGRLAAQSFIDYGQPGFSAAHREIAYGVNLFPFGLSEIG